MKWSIFSEGRKLGQEECGGLGIKSEEILILRVLPLYASLNFAPGCLTCLTHVLTLFWVRPDFDFHISLPFLNGYYISVDWIAGHLHLPTS